MISILNLFEITPIKNIPLRVYLRLHILPLYKKFDLAHDVKHAEMVADFCVRLAKLVKADPDIAYAVGLLHDVGIQIDRETHNLESGKFVRNSTFLKTIFNKDQVEMIAQAVEDHRASNTYPPRNIYGKIVADADRSDFMKAEDWMVRTWKYRKDMQKTHSDEEIFDEMFKRMQVSFGPNGTVKFYLPESEKILGPEFRRTKELAKDKEATYKIFKKLRKDNILKRLD